MNLPRVTRILSPFADFSMVPPEVLKAASERGTAVHEACAAYAEGLWMPPLDENLQGYFISFKAWFDEFVVETYAVEEEVLHARWGYLGHVDLIALVAGLKTKPVIAVVDYKTPYAESRSWRAQVAAYLEASRDRYNAEIAGALMLRKDGSLPKMVWVDDHNQAFAAFCGILSGWNYLQGGKPC